jgi:16S rRNA (adenine1518-N6/adenine1519-N6)-dimethyltransferase
VLAVELDAEILRYAGEELSRCANVEMINADIMRGRDELNPLVVRKTSYFLRDNPESRLKVVSNLPYHVAATVVLALLAGKLPTDLMILMVQSEMADRFAARPSTPEYGALSVMVQFLAEISILRKIPPQCFWPMPKVSSALMSFKPRYGGARAVPKHHGTFVMLIKESFAYRRKTLSNALGKGVLFGSAGVDADSFLRECGVAPEKRAEQLGVEEYTRIALAVHQRLNP